MKTIYLPIRSLGDFLISATIVKNKFTGKIPLLLPVYLKEFFDATNCGEFFEVLESINYNDQPAFYELYKVKDLTNLNRLVTDIKTFYSITNKNNKYLLDYSSKRMLFKKSVLIWPDVNQNIYYGKDEMFSEHFERKKRVVIEETFFNLKQFDRILILPGSRINKKRIDNQLVDQIRQTFKNQNIDIAEFGSNNSNLENVIIFSGFKNLIALINNYDLIISAESLPYHLANFLNKPHFVVYNNSKHFKRTFMTPFMLQNNYYSIFDNNNISAVIDRLQAILN